MLLSSLIAEISLLIQGAKIIATIMEIILIIAAINSVIGFITVIRWLSGSSKEHKRKKEIRLQQKQKATANRTAQKLAKRKRKEIEKELAKMRATTNKPHS